MDLSLAGTEQIAVGQPTGTRERAGTDQEERGCRPAYICQALSSPSSPSRDRSRQSCQAPNRPKQGGGCEVLDVQPGKAAGDEAKEHPGRAFALTGRIDAGCRRPSPFHNQTASAVKTTLRPAGRGRPVPNRTAPRGRAARQPVRSATFAGRCASVEPPPAGPPEDGCDQETEQEPRPRIVPPRANGSDQHRAQAGRVARVLPAVRAMTGLCRSGHPTVDLARGGIFVEVVPDIDIAVSQQAGGQHEVVRLVAGQPVPVRRAPPERKQGGEEGDAGANGNRRPAFTHACRKGHRISRMVTASRTARRVVLRALSRAVFRIG